jgi:hypothetical protein
VAPAPWQLVSTVIAAIADAVWDLVIVIVVDGVGVFSARPLPGVPTPLAVDCVRM